MSMCYPAALSPDNKVRAPMRTILLLPVLLLGPVIACATENIAAVHTADAQMNTAIQRARDSWNSVLKLQADPKSGAANFEVKVSFAGEVMWVSPFRANGDRYEGILRNVPQFSPDLSLGKQVQFSRSQIVDWGYMENGKRIGHFTTCVLLARQRPEEAASIKREMSLGCEP